MTEHTENLELTDQDVADLQALGVSADDLPNFHPILEVWREVLKPIDSERAERVTPGFAQRICSTYRGIEFADMEAYRDRYFDKLETMRARLLEEIESDEDCLKPSTPAEDVEHNSGHYRSLIFDWNLQILEWEMAWECTAPDAAIELAALSEVQKQFFSNIGLVEYLDKISFQFTDADRQALAEALQDRKDGQ